MKTLEFFLAGLGLAFAGMADTLVIAPGNGVTTNVAEVIGGATDVQINSAATGGGIVKLAARNTYQGTTYVKSGTLEVSSIGVVSQPGGMGAPMTSAGAIRLGNGTLRYTGAGEATDRALVLAPDASIASRPGILEVTNPDATLTFLGDYSIEGNTGYFIKTGPGTLAFAHQTPGYYRFAAGSQANNNFIDFKANGDSPTKGYRAFVVANGTVVFDNPMTVTNYFANEVQPGALSTEAAGAETGGRLVFRNGGQICDGWISVACICGTDVTNPDYAHAGILDVEGGYVQAANIGLAYGHSSDWDNARPHGVINLSGGTLYTPGNLRIDHTRSWGTVNVTGGLLQIGNVISVAHYTRGAQFDLNVQGPGRVVTGSVNFDAEGTTKGAASSKRASVTTIRLTEAPSSRAAR